MVFWKLRKRSFKWCHQSSYLIDKSIWQFGDTIKYMDYSPWSEAEKWQIWVPTKFWIDLKGLFLSFQKIIKFLTLDQRYQSYGCWKMFNYTPPLRLINGLETFSAAITWILWIQYQRVYDFLKAEKKIFQMVLSKFIFER